jgi:hypothetical protein
MLKHFRFLAAIAASCFLLAHCAGTVVKIMPGYKRMDVEKSKLGIIFLRENLTIADPKDIADYLGSGETKQVFYDFFTSQLKDFAAQDGKFAKVDVIGGCDTSGFSTISKRLSSDLPPLLLKIPQQKAFMGDSVPYLLVIDGIDVSREKKPSSTIAVMGMYGIPARRTVPGSDKLIMKGTFVLWDNSAGKTAAFGQISEKYEVVSTMTKDTWVAIVKSISSNIFIDKPYGESTRNDNGAHPAP